MKNILKIALVAISANCSADAANVIKNMSDHRMNFEHRAMTDIFTAVNSDQIKQIMQNLQGAKLKGMILHDFDVKGTQTEKADILVSLHNTEVVSYHIIKKSNDLKSLVDKPSKGYHLFTDALKNSIDTNEQKSEFKSKFHVAPLRRAALKEALENPGTFNHVKFAKEKQLTPAFINKTFEETFEQVNVATKMKKDADILHHDLIKILFSPIGHNTAEQYIEGKINAFIDYMTKVVPPQSNMAEAQITAHLHYIIAKDITSHPSLPLYKGFLSTLPHFMHYTKNYHSKESLKEKCEISIFLNYSIETHSNDSTAHLINNNMNLIHDRIANHYVKNTEKFIYNYQALTNAIANLIQKIKAIPNSDQFRDNLINRINKYQIHNFDSSEEEADAMYLDELYFADHTSLFQANTTNISGQYKMVVNLFDNDWTFPNASYFEGKSLNINSLTNSDIRYETLFGTSLYNSKMPDPLKAMLRNDRNDLIYTLQNNFNILSLNEKVKEMLSTNPVSKAKLDTLESKDFFNLCAALVTYANLRNKAPNLQALINKSLTPQP